MMAKTIALADPSGRLAELLTTKGYRLVSLQEANRFRAHVDAVLYGGRRHEETELTAGGSTLTAAGTAGDELSGAIMLNISGLNPEAVVAELEYRLQHRGWRW